MRAFAVRKHSSDFETIVNNSAGLQLTEPITFLNICCVVLKRAAVQLRHLRSMDGCGDSHRISASLRNALSVNNVKKHELSKTVKSLEAKRDYELMNLQAEKDRVISSVQGINKPSTKLSDTPQLSESGASPSLHPLNRDSLSRAHSLPPLFPPTSVLGTAPRLRRAVTLQQEQAHPLPAPPASARPRRAGSVKQANTMSLPCTPQASRKFFRRQFSSPGMMLANSTNSLRDLSHSEETLECQYRGIAGVVPSNITASLPKFPEQGKASNSLNRSRTPSEAEKGVHRGLHLRPISSSVTEKKEPKDKTKTTVFSRLYKNVKQARRMDSAGGRRLGHRQRSISMPDLSEMMENLKTCRYLRSADQKADSDGEI